jgi:Protein of unknown function (DUF3667)
VNTNCANCGYSLGRHDSYCASCGQKAGTHRLAMKHILHEVIHAFTHADKGFLLLIRELTIRPGYVAKDYVAGKRKKYFNPFTFLLLMVGLATFVTAAFNLMATQPGMEKNPGVQLVTRYYNFIVLLGVPLMAFFSWLLYRKDRFNYAENLVFTAFITGFSIMFHLLIFTPLVLLFRSHYFIVLYGYSGLMALYYVFACLQFFSGNRISVALRALLIAVARQQVMYFIVSFAIRLYFKLKYGH